MLAVLAMMVVAIPSATPIEIDRALSEVLADGDYQTTLPSGSNGMEWIDGIGGKDSVSRRSRGTDRNGDGSSGDGDGIGDGLDDASDAPARHMRSGDYRRVRWREDNAGGRREPRERRSTGDSGLGGTLVSTLLIVLGGLAILGIILSIMQRFRQSDVRPVGTIKAVVVAKPTNVVIIDPPELSLIERLAAARRYTEAVRELLRLAFDAASTQLHVVLPREQTSRELLAALPIHDSQRGALKRIVGAVEVGHFGKRELDVAEYRACREAFRLFEAGLAPQQGRS